MWLRLILCVVSLLGNIGQAQESRDSGEVTGAMKRAATYYRERVASHGGYVYHYSLDLKRRWGEGEATLDQIWVQPPGTPTVGLAYIRAFRATGDGYYRDAVEEVANALIYGQLKSGGWSNCIDFDPRGERIAQYRHGGGGGKNNSSLDDGQSQTAIRFMIQADQVFEFQQAAIHASAITALDALLAAQFANGGFPQVWTGSVEGQAVVPANFPNYDYRTQGRIKNYWDMPTLNDNVCVHVAHALMEAHQVYGEARYLVALKKLGDFLILAQMPEPQPAWAQQYNHAMQPIWARRFEPPGISGHESQSIVELLIEIAAYVQDKKYLDPLPSAIAYLRRSTLPDGQIARYYELQTNRPLYMQREGETYSLTYDDKNLPAHYSWKTRSLVDKLQARLAAAQQDKSPATQPSFQNLTMKARRIVQELDSQGRWITTADGSRLVGQAKLAANEQYLSSAAFSENLTTLSDYLMASQRQD